MDQKVLICGGRDFIDYPLMKKQLLKIIGHNVPTIIQGGAKGADFLAKVYCYEHGFDCIEYPADWQKYGKGAGHIRNQQMLDKENPEIVIAFQGGRGTADMIKRASKHHSVKRLYEL